MPEQTPSIKQSPSDFTVRDIVNHLVHSVAMAVDMETLSHRMADAFIQELADVTDNDMDERAGSEGQVQTGDENKEWVDEEENGEEVFETIESQGDWQDEDEYEQVEEKGICRDSFSDGTTTLSPDEEGTAFEVSSPQKSDEEAESQAPDTEPNGVEDDGCGFGGTSWDGLLSKEDHIVPCCKHLLACFLVEKCGSLLRPYIEQRSVDIDELAGMAAMSGI